MLMSVRMASTHSLASRSRASRPFEASRQDDASNPETSITRRTNARIAGESSTIKTRYAKICLPSVIPRRTVRAARRPPAARPCPYRFPAARCGIDPADRLAMQQDSRLPQDPAHRQIVAFADFEHVFLVHHLGPSNRLRHQPPLRRALAVNRLSNSGMPVSANMYGFSRPRAGSMAESGSMKCSRPPTSTADHRPPARYRNPVRKSPAPARDVSDAAIRNAHYDLCHGRPVSPVSGKSPAARIPASG